MKLRLIVSSMCFVVAFGFSANSLASKSIKSLPIEFASPDSVSVDRALDLNKATAEQLAKLSGMDSKRAKAIVNYRKRHGSFKAFYELNKVDGFAKLNPNDLRHIEDQLKIG